VVLAIGLWEYIGLRGTIDSYRKNPSNKIFYIMGLFALLIAAASYWNSKYNNSELLYIIVLFVIATSYLYVWKKNGYLYGTERYENTVAAKIVKFFGGIFVIVTSILLLLVIAFWLGWIKI